MNFKVFICSCAILLSFHEANSQTVDNLVATDTSQEHTSSTRNDGVMEWRISASSGYQISLNFTFVFGLDPSFLIISENGTDRLNFTSAGTTYLSQTNQVVIRNQPPFVNLAGAGFVLEFLYQGIPPAPTTTAGESPTTVAAPTTTAPDFCGGNFVATATPQTFRSPGDGTDFLINVPCTWNITTQNPDQRIQISFLSIELTPVFQSVTIFDAGRPIAAFFGTPGILPSYTSTSNSFRIVLLTTTNVSSTIAGFVLQYSAINVTMMTNITTTMNMTTPMNTTIPMTTTTPPMTTPPTTPTIKPHKDCDANDTIVLNSTFAANAEYNYVCDPISTEFWLNQSLVQNFGFTIDSLAFVYKNLSRINNPQCSFNNTGNENYYIRLNQYFGQCASDISVVDDLYYRVWYVLCVYPVFPSIISRYKVIYFYFSCTYDLKVNRTLLPLEPVVDTQRFIEPNNTAKVNTSLQINRYTNSSFTTLETSTTAYDGDQVYLRVCIDVTTQRRIALQGLQCKVTETSDPNANRQLTIIDNGCPISDPLPGGSRRIYQNFATNCFAFSFTSFHWTAPPAVELQSLYVHCVLNVCDRDNNATCVDTPTCPQTARKRRDVGSTNQNEVFLSHGPITLKNKPTIPKRCNKEFLGCEYDCGITSTGEETCFCPPGTILESNRKSCYVHVAQATETDDLLFLVTDGVSYTLIFFSLALLLDNLFFKKITV